MNLNKNIFLVKKVEPPKEPIILIEPKTNSKIFQCPYDVCNKRFKEKGNLKTHMRVHVIIHLLIVYNVSYSLYLELLLKRFI